MQCECRRFLRKPNIETNRVDDYYFDIFRYPRMNARRGEEIGKRENVIIALRTTITFQTTIEELIKYCSNKNIEIFNKDSIDSIAAVAIAAKMGNVPLLESLVDKLGAAILNTCDQNDFTPLHIVCHETRLIDSIYSVEQICIGAKKLIELGANPNLPSNEGYRPLSTSALKAKNMPLTDLLIRNHAKITSCVSHLQDFVIGKGFIKVESIIKANIREAQTARAAMKTIRFLYIAKKDADSTLSIFPAEILKIITLLFWQHMAHIE